MPKPRKQKGDGFLDSLKSLGAQAKILSDATGIKPSALLQNVNHPLASLGASLLASKGLGKPKKKRAPKKKKQAGGNFFDDLFSPVNALVSAGGNVLSGLTRAVAPTVGTALQLGQQALPMLALGGLGRRGRGVLKAGAGRRAAGRRQAGGCGEGFPGTADSSASVVKF